MEKLNNINISSSEPFSTPEMVKLDHPLSDNAAHVVLSARETIRKILKREDPRLMVIVGPCSIHDEKAALEYAKKLKVLSTRISKNFFVIMRVYFEKPRTTVGWKGFINDPYMDESYKIDEGVHKARKLMLDINEMGLPIAVEALDPIMAQYFDDLVSWAAIGARTTESQTHRGLASGLSTPVGFKNSTDGSFDIAINAMEAAACSQHILSVDERGNVRIFITTGNPDTHIVLRGGKYRPNYDSVSVKLCEKALDEHKLAKNIVIDCSHSNSFKKPDLQLVVLHDIVGQLLSGNKSIVGFMMESNLKAGCQKLIDPKKLEYGVSITDACIGWEITEKCLIEAHDSLNGKLANRHFEVKRQSSDSKVVGF